MSMNRTGTVRGTFLSLQRWVHDLIHTTFLFAEACVIWKSPGSLITSGSSNETGTPRTLKFLFYNLHQLRGSWVPVISSPSFTHLSETCLILVRWGENGKNLEQGLVVTKNRKWVEAYKQWQLQPRQFYQNWTIFPSDNTSRKSTWPEGSGVNSLLNTSFKSD